MKLSIIICVYNTPKQYLSECINSIVRSTVNELRDDYEICMVDDGSTENYTDIITKYGIRVTKTENRGIFSARKTGIEMARGEFSIFCDSDDTVSFNYYLPMLRKAEETNADIVINDWATKTARANYYAKNDETIKTSMDISGDDTLLSFVKNEGRQHSFYVLWNKLYKTELLLGSFQKLLLAKNDFSSSFSEDAAINFFAWRDARRIVNVHTGFYFYRIHTSQSVTIASEQKLRTQIDSMSETLEIMRNNIGNNEHKESIIKHVDEWAELMSRSHYSFAKGLGYNQLFAHIKKKYGVKKLTMPKVKDGAIYEHKVLLGENFDEVDSILFNIWNSPSPVRCDYSKKDLYTERAVDFLREEERITDDKSATTVVVPRLKSSFKNRVIHNVFLHKLGLVLFKKGSKAREFLKKFT